jgi:DNA mismatch repair protein MutS2
MHATRPLFHSFDDSTAREPLLKLILARHPLLAGEIVPIDIELGGAFDVLLITGPNTGGKTVALKTAGLLALMAQAGLQIPAAEGSATTVFSGVFADIGDEQSIEQSLSTFSSHITRIIETLKSADSHSLVLLDEVGAGTDPLEGAALSRAILEHLVQSHILTIATTHFSELKVFAYDAARVQNASVEFNPETLLPTYRLIIGLPGRSNALTIAERLGLPPSIVSAARGFISPDERRVDELLAEIHQELEHARSERADESRRRLEAERLERQVKARLATAEEERSTILAGAEEEVAVLMSELRREADAIRRELRGLGEERRRSSALEERIAALRARAGTVLNRRPEATVAHGPFALGESVLVASLGATGIVRSLSSDGDVAEVEVGGMRARVRIGDLSPSVAAPTPRDRARAAGYLNSADSPRGMADRSTWSGVQSQIDLRGLTTEEGRQRVDQYLNDAYMEGVSLVRIIHGKGTGALRQAVHELLADHPLVRSHATADRSEGGEGATVVHIAT